MNSKISHDTKSKNLQLFLIQYISTFANWKKNQPDQDAGSAHVGFEPEH